MANKTTTKATEIPAAVLEAFDNLNWEDVTAEALAGFTITGIDGGGCECITLCGIYPFQGTTLYVFNIYHDEESAYMKYQRAMVP